MKQQAKDICPGCNKKIRDEETVICFGREYHKLCCPHQHIKRNRTHSGKGRKKLYCLDCDKILCGKDMKEIKLRKEREAKKRNGKIQN